MEDYSKYSGSELGALFRAGNGDAFKEVYIRLISCFLFAT